MTFMVRGSSCCLGTSSQFMPRGSDQQTGSSFVDSMVELPWAATEQGLTFIGYQVDEKLSLRRCFRLIMDCFFFHTNISLNCFFPCYRIHQTVEMFIQVKY